MDKIKKDFIVFYLVRNAVATFIITICSFVYDFMNYFNMTSTRAVIKIFSEPGDVVLDCFMGSGTSAMAAIKENRHYIGIDKVQEYVDLSKRNIEAFRRAASQMTINDLI